MFVDFNVATLATDRSGTLTVFNASQASSFNEFIPEVWLLDIPMGGRKFTWIRGECKKMSWLDRFFASDNLIDWFPNILVRRKRGGGLFRFVKNSFATSEIPSDCNSSLLI